MRSAYDIVKAHYAASDRGDLAGMVADFAPDMRWTEMDGFAYAGTYIGPEAVVEKVFKRIGQDFSDFDVKVETLLDAGDHVAAIANYVGTGRATGKAFSVRVVHVWRVEAGKISRFEQFCDTLRLAEAMGR